MKLEVPEGVGVRFSHARRVQGDWALFYRKKEGWDVFDPEKTSGGSRPHPSADVLPHGGRTTCKLTFPDGTEIWGVAECSGRDQYNKKIGRDISLGRALKQAERKDMGL